MLTSQGLNFSGKTKLHELVGPVQFVVFEKFTSASLRQVEQQIKLSLINNLQKVTTDKTFSSHAHFSEFVLVLHEKCTRF